MSSISLIGTVLALQGRARTMSDVLSELPAVTETKPSPLAKAWNGYQLSAIGIETIQNHEETKRLTSLHTNRGAINCLSCPHSSGSAHHAG